MKNISVEKVEESQPILQNDKPVTKTLPKQIFSNDELKTAWLRYAEVIKEKMPRMYQIFQTHIPVKISDTLIELQLESESQRKELMEKNNSDLMKFLKEELSNFTFELKLEIAKETESKNLIYTSTDKFKYLAEQNQALNLLKKKFNLDFD